MKEGQLIETTKELIADFGGGRKKSSQKSQLFYDTAKQVLLNFNDNTYSEIAQFTKYLKEVAKKQSVIKTFGIEQPTHQTA